MKLGNPKTSIKKRELGPTFCCKKLIRILENIFGPGEVIYTTHSGKAVTGNVLQEKVFLEISKNSQENTYTRVSFLVKLQA